MKKIAFCFLIRGDINHEELWNMFFKDIDPNKYNIYIHYKYNDPLKYFEKYKLNECIETKYANISLVKAQNVLLQNAMKDINNKHFVFVSNSCIPLKCFDYVYNKLNEGYSYFNIDSQTACFPRCNNTLNFIDKKYIQKTSQWCILNRKHAELMLATHDYMNWFDYPSTAPDEHCYITNIYYHNLQHEIIATPNLSNDATTFVNWGGNNMVYKYKYEKEHGLKNYDSIDKEELLYLLNSKCFFGRKFNNNCYSHLYITDYIDSITTTLCVSGLRLEL